MSSGEVMYFRSEDQARSVWRGWQSEGWPLERWMPNARRWCRIGGDDPAWWMLREASGIGGWSPDERISDEEAREGWPEAFQDAPTRTAGG